MVPAIGSRPMLRTPHVWSAALMRAASESVNSNSLDGSESAGFHSTPSTKATLSTGETGEFAAKSLGSGRNPGG